MNIRSFNLRIVIRILLLGAIMFVFVFSLRQEKWYMTTTVSMVLIIALILELINYLHKYQRDFSRFVMAVKSRDHAGMFISKRMGHAGEELEKAFYEIMQAFEHVRIDKELHYQYLQAVIEHIRVGFLCFDDTGKIHVVNNAALNLMHLKRLNQIGLLVKVDKSLMTTIQNIRPGEQKLFKVLVDGEMLQLAIIGTTFKLQDRTYHLVSLQDIRKELEAKEVDAWKKLIRILTHEIMNSVTPISSLSRAINTMLEDNEGRPVSINQIQPDDLDDMRDSMKTIEERSRGLLHFVEDYKSLTRLPMPKFSDVILAGLLNHLKILLEPELETSGIELNISIENDQLTISADQDMLEQVMINLILNAKQALEEQENKEIMIRVFTRNEGSVVIEVVDNGHGIEAEILEHIFVPFFTTRKGGSGIGLSLSRQIMQMHGGSISVVSEPGKGAVFTLNF